MPLDGDARASAGRHHPLGRSRVGARATARRRSIPRIYDAGVPVLGICYGAQLVAPQLGGEVRETGGGEYGRTALELGPHAGVGAVRRSARSSRSCG